MLFSMFDEMAESMAEQKQMDVWGVILVLILRDFKEVPDLESRFPIISKPSPTECESKHKLKLDILDSLWMNLSLCPGEESGFLT